jgi:hypothetical protein
MTDEARKGLSKSIDRYGLVQPIIWNKKTGNVVGGHQRLTDIIKKGAKETDVVVVNLPLDEEKAMNVALNNPHIAGDFTDGLQELLKTMPSEVKTELRLEELELLKLCQKN